MHFDRIAADFVAERIQPLLELRLRQDHPRMLDQRFEQRPFARGQVDPRAGARHAARGDVDRELAELHERIRIARIAARDRAHARGQLGQVERLDQIVVGAGVQPRDPVRDLIERGQDDDGHRRAARAQLAQEIEPTPVGQQQIEQDQIVGRDRDVPPRVREARDAIGRMPVLLDLGADGLAEPRIVFDEKHSHARVLVNGVARLCHANLKRT
ncbi:hypothetical protein DP56_5938 [Burkholderia pseudomallei]|nr:hypothetical protein DP56_5938 [Burkholderia pseudomallei]